MKSPKTTYLILTFIVVFSTFLAGQSILKPFVVTYTDGSIAEGQMASQNLENLAKEVTVKIDGEDMILPKSKVKSLLIDDNEKYERVNNEFLQVLVEGDASLYISQSGWMYVGKPNQELVRLENHYQLVDKGVVLAVDTIQQENNPKEGLWKVKRDYYYTLSKLFADKAFAVSSIMTLSPSSVKAQVKKYNSIEPGIIPKAYFKGSSFMYFYGGAQVFSSPQDGLLFSPDYYFEFGDSQTLKRLSVYFSYRPEFMRNDLDFTVAEFGIRVKIIIEDKFEPFLKVGAVVGAGTTLDEDLPSLLQFSGGIRYHISRDFGIETAISNSRSLDFRIGLVGRLF